MSSTLDTPFIYSVLGNSSKGVVTPCHHIFSYISTFPLSIPLNFLCLLLPFPLVFQHSVHQFHLESLSHTYSIHYTLVNPFGIIYIYSHALQVIILLQFSFLHLTELS